VRDVRTFEKLAAVNLIKLVGLTDDHSWDLEPVLRTSNLAGSTTKLGIDLHSNVGAVLRLSLHDMSNVETLELATIREREMGDLH
jgi:hypothetical protein